MYRKGRARERRGGDEERGESGRENVRGGLAEWEEVRKENGCEKHEELKRWEWESRSRGIA